MSRVNSNKPANTFTLKFLSIVFDQKSKFHSVFTQQRFISLKYLLIFKYLTFILF